MRGDKLSGGTCSALYCRNCLLISIGDAFRYCRLISVINCQLTGNVWSEDPACYLSDDEIGISVRPDLRPGSANASDLSPPQRRARVRVSHPVVGRRS